MGKTSLVISCFHVQNLQCCAIHQIKISCFASRLTCALFVAVMTQLWPYLAAYITKQAAPQVDPLLATNKPAWMESIKLIK